jgi:hypothetical protein
MDAGSAPVRPRASAPTGRVFSGLVAYDDVRVAIDSGGISTSWERTR